MPFSPTKSTKDWDKVYKKVFKPTIENLPFGYECSKSKIKNVSFSEEIIKNLKNADLVLADLTDFNPNVMWELGIRHTVSRKTIMICQKNQIDDLPSDIRHFGVIGYGKDITDAEEFKEEIKEMISEIETDSTLNTSPVRNVIDAEDLILSNVQRNAIKNQLSGLLTEFLLNFKLAEDFLSDKLTVNKKNISFRRFENDAIKLLRKTNYVPVSEKYVNTAFNLLIVMENANNALDKALFNSKGDLQELEGKVKNNSKHIVTDLKFLIKETNSMLKILHRGENLEGEPIISFFEDEHKKLID